jgi:hypothetical protein
LIAISLEWEIASIKALDLIDRRTSILDATNRRRRSGDKLNQLPYAKIAAHRAVRTTIRQELKAGYEIPQDLLHEMIAPLTRLNRAEN